MKFSLFKDYGALNSKPIFDAFETSLHNAGHTICYNDMNCDVAVIWSVLFHGRMAGNKTVWNHYRSQNKSVIVIEVGGIDRGVTWKVGLNGINRDAYFGPSDMDDLRSRKLGLRLKPWRQHGDYILICGQHDKSLQWQNMPAMSNWFLQTYDNVRKYTDRPIVFRPHPRCRLPEIERGLKYVYRQDPRHINGTYDDFDMKFENVWATISCSSNPGPQSIIAGVPAFVSKSSLAHDVGNSDWNNIESPLMPDRQQWLNNYAWTEYTVKEIQSGLPLKNLTSKL
jgi:hypothetical protein